MYMQYYSGFLSLQLRNYINGLSFNISRNKRVYFRSGFYVDLNYRPWSATWQYGYDKQTQGTDYDDNGNPYTVTTTNFAGRPVPAIPVLASTSWDTGAFVSITLSTVRKHKYYSR